MEIKVTFNLMPILGCVFTLAGFYLPGFNTWLNKLTSQQKQLVMLGLIVACDLVAVAVCLAGFQSFYHGPTWREWIWYPLVDTVAAIIVNAGVYKAINYLPK